MVFAFVVAISGVVFAQTDSRTPEEKLSAGRDYLKLLDQKIIRLRKEGKMTLVAKMQADKKSTIARMQQWKAEAETAQAAPTAPKPVAPSAVPAKPAAAASAGLFGWGINTDLTGLYINTGKGQLSGSLGLRADWVLDDFVGLGPMVGLSDKAIQYKLGLGYVQGGGGIKAIPVFADGVINLPADMMGGVKTYLAGGINYVVDGNGQTSGKVGGEISIGLKADLGLGLGETAFELGWAAVRSNTRSSKGLTLAVSQPIGL
jgi:hypothetical protein